MDTTIPTRTTRRRIPAVAVALLVALLAPLLVVSPAAATGGSHDDDRRLRAVLRCHGAPTDDDAPSVVCNWGARTTGAAEIVLVRVTRTGDERGTAEVVARFDDLTTERYVDTDVEFGTLYRYRVFLLDEDGHRIGRSRADRAVVADPLAIPAG